LIRFVALFLISFAAVAAPKEIEVWFISNAKVALLNELLNRPQYIYRAPTAELQCQQMGDYCFDPQFGLYKKDDANKEEAETVETTKIETDGPSIAPAKSVERELIDCDPKNYFDVFCGKARKEAQVNTKLDIWMDTSSSLREFDPQDKDGSCHRKSFMKQLDDVCGFNQKVNVMMFDTSIKQAGGLDSMCTTQGLNDYKRLMDWIERSEAKKLIVITDIYEFHKEFSDYIESKHGKFRGDKDPLTAKQMVELADDLAKSCK
jgi:hypothetical protein